VGVTVLEAGRGERIQSGPPPPSERVQLLGQFRLESRGGEIHLPLGAQRLVALLALRGGLTHRSLLAGTLWPDKGEARAGANLRSSLWRVGQASPQLVDCSDGGLGLTHDVAVDVVETAAYARSLLDPTVASGHADLPHELPARPLLYDLLPDWYDDWLLWEREYVRQVRMHALEALCGRLTDLGRFAEAISAGLAAVAAEPLRESAHLALMRAHRAEGNRCEVLVVYHRLCLLLRDELGAKPSPRVEAFLNVGD